MPENDEVLDWGAGWEPLGPDNPFQRQLRRELHQGHPLTGLDPGVFGRCLSCDDVVAALARAASEPRLAVIHLTWAGRPDPGHGVWPCFERVTTAAFVERFLRAGEHL